LFDYKDKLVVSDIDGTVTKSDALGHFLPSVGISDWSHKDIASFYTNIPQNGYKLVYLSSRPVGFSKRTRVYIDSIKQDNNHVMPGGPILLSPDRTFESTYREMIIKKPHIFKIECLKQVKNLFPEMQDPFYAGFGNRITDYISYKTLGVNVSRIYIIDSKSAIKNYDSGGFVSSYDELNKTAEFSFPTVRLDAEGFNEKSFWNINRLADDTESKKE